jgi:hypothetical protein
MFRGKLIGGLGFSHRGEYIGRRAASGGGPGGLTPWWHGPGLGRAALECGPALAPSVSSLDFVSCLEKKEVRLLFCPIPRIPHV